MSVASELAVRFTADTSGLEAGGAKAEGLISRMTGGLGKLGLAGMGLGVIKGGIEGIAGAAMGLTAGNAEFERYETQLTTLMGSSDAAKQRLAELAEFGAKTPFELPEIARAEKVLLGFGLAGEKALALSGKSAEELRTVIGDVAAGTGVAFEEVALTFGKFSSGATGEAIARLQELGVVTKEQMAEVGIQFSKSGELLSPLPDAFAAATAIAADKFGGGMDALSNTFEGKLSTLSDAWGELKRTMMAPVFDVAKAALDKIAPVIATLTEKFGALIEGFQASGEWSSSFGETVATLAEQFLGLKDGALSGIVDKINGLIGLAGAFKTGFADAGGGLDGIFGGLLEMAASLGVNEETLANVSRMYGTFMDEAGSAISSIVGFVKDKLIPIFLDFSARVFAGFQIVAPIIASFAGLLIEKLWPVIKSVFGFVADHAGVFATLGAVIAMVAGGPVTMIVVALAAIGTIVPKVVEWFTTVRDTIASAVGAALGSVKQTAMEIVMWWEQLRADTAAKWQAIKDGIAAAVDAIRQWITDKFNAIRDFIRSVKEGIRNIILGVWNKIPADIRERLVEIYNNVVAKFAEVKFAIATAWDTVKTIVAAKVGEIVGGIKEWFAGMVDNVREAFTTARDAIADTVGGWRDVIVEKINGFLDPIRQKWQEIREAIVAKVGEITGAVREKFADIKNAITGKLGEAKTAAGDKAREILATLLDPFKNIFADISKVGKDLLDGLRQGITNSWQSFKDWFWNKIRSIVGLSREAVDAHSPSQEFARLGEDIVAGLRLGLIGLRDVAAVIQEVFGKMIGSADVENFEMIHRLTSSLLGIFEDASDGIRKLLDFDIVATTDQIKAAFDRLVEVFMVAVGQMAELSKFAGRGTQPGQEGFINLDHINNIERFTGAVQNTLNVASATVDILEKLSKLTLPGAGAITALIPFLQEVANAAAVFEKPLGKDEDAIQVFERGAIVAGHIATFAKNVADLTSIKFSAVSSAFAREMTAAAAAAELAWQAVKDAAALWGDKISTERDKLIVGVKAYAEAVGAAVSILKGAAELKIDVETLATDAQLRAAAKAAASAAVQVYAIAKWWTENTVKEWGRILDGMKAYAEAAGAAVGLLKTAADLDFRKAVEVTDEQWKAAADASEKAANQLGRIAKWWIDNPTKWQPILDGMKAYADAAGAAVSLLGSAGALDFSKAVKATDEQWKAAADASKRAYEELRKLAADFIAMGEEMTGPIVAGIKAFADAAGTALDLLAKGASGINALSEVKQLGGVQPRLVHAIVRQLGGILDTLAKEKFPTLSEETAAKLKSLADSAGIFDTLAKVAEGMNALGAVKQLAGVQLRLVRAIVEGANAAITEVTKSAGSFGTEAIAKVKSWGEASAVTLGALTTAADGLNKMSAKLTIPDDLSARVTALVTAMRIVVDSMADALDAGAIRLDVAKAGADVAAAVGAIADAMGPVFDAINAAISSPFGRIRATGQRGDTFRQNIANRIRASIVAAVTAISDALKELPTINVPDELVTQVDKLASVYERILDVIERLGEVKVDTRSIAALSAAMATLAGGVAAGAPGGAIAVTSGGSGTTLTVSSGPGGGIEITNVYSPTVTPMPVTISTTNNINIGQRTIETIATEVKILQELELRQGQTT